MMNRQDSSEKGSAMNESTSTNLFAKWMQSVAGRVMMIAIPIAVLSVASYLVWTPVASSNASPLAISASAGGADSVQAEIATLEKMWKEHSGHGPIALRLGNLYSDRNEFDKAEEMYRAFLSSDTSAAGWEVKLDLARCLFAQKKVDEARAELRGILEQHPQHAGALYNLGAIEANTGNTGEAKRLWAELVRVHPDDESAVLARNGLATLSQMSDHNQR
jgi:tetratricopeptide (TPR) repeat protein